MTYKNRDMRAWINRNDDIVSVLITSLATAGMIGSFLLSLFRH